jgi:thioesterase domain-containing protein
VPLSVRDANFQAYLAYHAQPYHGKLTIFQGSELGESGYRKPKLGWESVALGGIDLHPIPGNHMTILYEPCVSELGRKLAECLDEVYAREAEMCPETEALEQMTAP